MLERPPIGEKSPGAVQSPPDSDEQIRNLKSTEAAQGAFQAAGIPNPSADLMAIVSAFVKSQTRAIPFGQIANMPAGSGQLNASATVGVNAFMNTLDTRQREMLRLGLNPLDPASMQRFANILNGLGQGGMFMSGNGTGGQNGSRFDTLKGRDGADGQYVDPAKMASAVNYAQSLGLDPTYARLFVKLDQNNRGALSDFVTDIRNNPALSEEETRKKIAAFRKTHPQVGKALTDDQVLDIIRGGDKLKVEMDGAQRATHDESQANKYADKVKLGIAKQVEIAHVIAVNGAKAGDSDDLSNSLLAAAEEKPTGSQETKKATATEPASGQKADQSTKTANAADSKAAEVEKKKAIQKAAPRLT